jgi:hypothetical protein
VARRPKRVGARRGSSSAQPTGEPASAEESDERKALIRVRNRAAYVKGKARAAAEAASGLVNDAGAAMSAFARKIRGGARSTAHAVVAAKFRARHAIVNVLKRYSPRRQAELLDSTHDMPELAAANALRRKQPATETQMVDSYAMSQVRKAMERSGTGSMEQRAYRLTLATAFAPSPEAAAGGGSAAGDGGASGGSSAGSGPRPPSKRKLANALGASVAQGYRLVSAAIGMRERLKNANASVYLAEIARSREATRFLRRRPCRCACCSTRRSSCWRFLTRIRFRRGWERR